MKTVMQRCATGAAGLAAILGAAAPASAATPTAGTASAVGNEAVPAISVSPDYARTGFAIAMAYELRSGCSQSCVHLWATHDRGASWKQLAAADWQRGMPSIAIAPGDHEVVLAGGAQVQRSDDGGATWRSVVSSSGAPAAGPPFSADGTLAVAGQGSQDLLVHASGGTSPVAGSGGLASDVQFAYAPGFPSAGSFAPLLLSALDTKTGTTLVEQCTTGYTCSSPVTLASGQKMPGAATLVMSPGYTTDGTVFAVEPTALMRSTDGGRSFLPLSIGAPGATATSVGSLALDPDFARNHVAYAAVLQIFTGKAGTSGGVYRTADGGTTWTRVGSPSPFDHGATSLAVAQDGRIFAGFVDQGATQAGGLECWDGVAWSAFCGVHSSTSQSGSASHAGGAASGGTSHTATASDASTSSAAALPGGDGSAHGSAPPLTAAASSTGSRLSTLVPIALVLLGVLGAGAAVARLRERRRAARPRS